MKLSCLPVSLFPDISSGKISVKEYARLCKRLALDGFDLGIVLLKNHTPAYIKQFNKDCDEIGLLPAMITTYPDFTHPDPVQRDREFEYLRHDIALASNVGARFLRITAGQAHPDMPVEKGIDLVVDNFRNIAPVAEKFGVKLVYEDHSKPGAWDYMDFSNPPDIFLAIASQIADTGIGINFDTANILVSGNETTLDVLKQVVDNVESIHVAETATLGKMVPVLLGEGLAPIREVFQLLKKHGWDKWLCIEEWSNMGIKGVIEAVKYTRKLWEEV